MADQGGLILSLGWVPQLPRCTGGPHSAGYIEAHHLIPLAALAHQPGKLVLEPRTDFTVVCANCHRMLHRGSPPPSVAELRTSVRDPEPSESSQPSI